MTPLYTGQLRGACVICAAALLLYMTRAYVQHRNDTENRVPAPANSVDLLAVELDGDVRHRGIYFLPPGATVDDLLRRVDNSGMENVARRDRETHVKEGARIVVTRGEHAEPRISYGMMSNAKRYVLDIPIDVNTATVAELMLVPGIGKYTARQIIQYRDRCGVVKRLSELKSIPEMGQQKFTIIRRHFCVGGGRAG